MANIRKCIICGTKYEYCIHCGDNKQEETWRYVYHDETCMAIAHTWRAYKGDEISKKDFIDILDLYPDHRDMILNNDSIISNSIKDVYESKEKKSKDNILEENFKDENHVEDHVGETTTDEVVVTEEQHEEPKTVKITRNRKK